MEKITYPDEVELFLNIMHMSFVEDGFYKDYDIEKYGEVALREVAAPVLMKLWVNGNLQELSDEQLGQIMKETVTMALFFSLRNKGMIDWIQDETGKDVMFVTKLGKEVIHQNKNI
jgi:hypothetical protein